MADLNGIRTDLPKGDHDTVMISLLGPLQVGDRTAATQDPHG